MKKYIMFLAFAVIASASCKREYKTENGLEYIKYTDNDGPRIKQGDFVAANWIIKTDTDSLLFSTYEAGAPRLFILLKPTFKGDIFDAMKLLTVGDSMAVKLPLDSVFKHSPEPPNFRKNKFITYQIKIVKVIPKGNMTDKELAVKSNAYMQGLILALKNAEPEKIKNYIADKKLNVTKTDSGLYYVINKKGTGPTAVAGDTVVVNYTGTLFSGKIFDTDIKADAVKGNIVGAHRYYAPIRVVIGHTKAIAGWNQSLLLLNKGAKGTFIMPAKLAYGEDGYSTIGTYMPVVFDMEVLNIIHPGPKPPIK